MSPLPTPEQLQYMVAHQSDDLRGSMIASSAAGGTLAIVFVILRIMARKMPGIPLGADDWWMLASLVSIWNLVRRATIDVEQFLYLGTPIVFAWTTKYGGGRHVILLTDPRAFAIVGDPLCSME